ncbi:hypothetical protein ACLEPN_00825 [Myxococcus sp. 1LA]
MRRFISRLSLSLLALMGCRDQPSAEARFWQWFESNSARLAQPSQDQERIFDELQNELSKAHDGLTFELGPVVNGSRELAISADGIKEHFSAVQTLVAAAPKLPRWRVVAFRQRKGPGYTVQLGTLSLSPDDVWFRVEAQPRQPIQLFLYINNFEQGERQRFAPVVYLLLDDILGEYDVETKIDGIEFDALPKNPKESGLRPLPDLAIVVDGIFSPDPTVVD